ncbi:uncharacterized protein STEHIDRAFT_116202 [Stereum hirsutum FP-91666 SS1]|uniref:Zn(2)-C6 fungal-type domain-containing protein n=1 Tax=Stereum hirsutum (strain FP-91666) TaxID=721885 RepID=R7RXA2_STEHR|nr:uncharacterized protein STEHIDRAFT_116202 [Stereum hirsutum FP-91666 SS1]EIM80016.1 hypothetical protein STEHIDRAFT_116202 [Stereum hirsutum FP-91666 SS1]
MTSAIPRDVIIKIVHQLLTASTLISEAAAILQSRLLLSENQTRDTSQLTHCANQCSGSRAQPGGVQFIREGPSLERPEPGPSSTGSTREAESSMPPPSVIPQAPQTQLTGNIGAVRTSTQRSIKTRGPYTAAACIACRRAKRKCISLSPGNEECAQCIMRDQPCVYPAAPESVSGASVDMGEGSSSSTLDLNITPTGDPAPQTNNTESGTT